MAKLFLNARNNSETLVYPPANSSMLVLVNEWEKKPAVNVKQS